MSADRDEIRATLVALVAGSRQLVDRLERVLADDAAFDRLLARGATAWTASAAMAPVVLRGLRGILDDVLDESAGTTADVAPGDGSVDGPDPSATGVGDTDSGR